MAGGNKRQNWVEVHKERVLSQRRVAKQGERVQREGLLHSPLVSKRLCPRWLIALPGQRRTINQLINFCSSYIASCQPCATLKQPEGSPGFDVEKPSGVTTDSTVTTISSPFSLCSPCVWRRQAQRVSKPDLQQWRLQTEWQREETRGSSLVMRVQQVGET